MRENSNPFSQRNPNDREYRERFFGQSLKAFSTFFLIYAILASLARLQKELSIAM